MSRPLDRRVVLVAALVLGIGGAHFLVPAGPHGWHWIHLALQKLHYVPLVLAAAWWGLRGSLPTAAVLGALFLAHIAAGWRGDSMSQADQLAEIGNLWLVAVLAGLLSDRLRRSFAALRRAHEDTLGTLASCLELRERDTAGHSQRVRDYTLELADRLGIAGAEREALAVGALLHDIGKIGTPDEILLKERPLTEDEWLRMREHPEAGARLIGPLDFLASARETVLAHHERWDGSGYPRGLRGRDIPFGARIFAVADVLDALTTDRPYRRAGSFAEAAAYIRAGRGRLFDPAVVDAFETIPLVRWEELSSRHGVVLRT